MGKVALVSGSSRGIGKGIAKRLIEENYSVYITGRNENDVSKTAREFGTQAIPKVCNLQDETEAEALLQEIEEKYGALDLLVCNIGSGKSIPGWDIPLEEYRRIFEINFFNAVMLSTRAVHRMPKKMGHIVFITSIAGCETLGAPITYSCAKTALISYAKNLSLQVAAEGIRVNCVSPGNVMFEGSTWDDKTKQNSEWVKTYIKTNVPMNDFAFPEDIAEAVLYLERSRFVTGENLIVDGGQLNKII